jgi:phage-related protein
MIRTFIDVPLGGCSAIHKQIETMETATRMRSALRQIESKDVKKILQDISQGIEDMDRDDHKEIMRNLIERIVFDFTTLDCCIYY